MARRQAERARVERCKREPALLAELRALREAEDSMARQLAAAQATEAETVAALRKQHEAVLSGEAHNAGLEEGAEEVDDAETVPETVTC